ncbi:MAG: Pentapeptide repeat (8 copies), partial [Firmicutes bacterium]|nr:Pentapeptide repeat (8 copies) [Bacillota bacterium]
MAKKDVELNPVAPNLPPQLALAQISAFHDEECMELCLIQECAITDQIADNLVINQVVFKNVVFTRVHWPNVKLTDILFEQCDLSNVDFSLCFMYRVQFRDRKMVGINLTEASLRNVV